MTVSFQTQLANCVLLTPMLIPGVVNHPSVVQEVQAEPVTLVQLPQFALAAFPNLQISYVEQSPGQWNLIVAETGEKAPSERLDRVTRAAFRVALEAQSPIALGMNFVRMGQFREGTTTSRLLDLLRPETKLGVKTLGIAPLSAGIKLYYNRDDWRVALTIDSDLNNPQQVVASSNFHASEPRGEAVGQLLAQRSDVYESFVMVVEQILTGAHDDGTR